MKDRIGRTISSSATTIALLLLYALGLAVATFVEKHRGTAVAMSLVYHSPLFFLLQALLVANFVALVIRRRWLRKGKWAPVLVHFAFIVILAGAMTTHLFGQEGVMHLREGETSNKMLVRSGDKNTVHTLPFSVELKDFTLARYPGSASPSSFQSEVVVHLGTERRTERIFMNNVLDIKGYRFFQTSYDQDEQGTVLSVNSDLAGRRITYAGYALLLVGFVIGLLDRGSRFMRLSRRLRELRNASLLLLAAVWPLAAEARDDASYPFQTVHRYRVSPEHAEKFGALPLQSATGRMMPVNTFSSEILRKLHRSDTFGSLTPEQFLLSLLAMPEVWMRVPLIAVPNAELARHYGLTPGMCAYAEAFDGNGDYRLKDKLAAAYGKTPASRTRFDKDLMKLDEQINLFSQLIQCRWLNLFPLEADPAQKWYAPGDDLSVFSGKDSMFVSRVMDWYLSEVQKGLRSGDWTKADEVLGMIQTYQQAKGGAVRVSPQRIRAELKYNRLRPFRHCRVAYLSLGGMLLLFSFLALFCRNRLPVAVLCVLGVGVAATFLFHTFGMALRWYIGGYAPWSNSYETMVYVAWASVLGGMLFARRSAVAFALATLLGGIVLFVSGLNWMDPEITPLVPVLKSPWLMFHVAVVVAAYGFFGIGCLLGLANMVLMAVSRPGNVAVLRTRIAELGIVNEMALWVGLAFMTVGTFLGAVWANESWGRYWGWDPKETWALVTVVVYAVVTHLHLAPRFSSPWLFNLSSVVAFASVLMTFFGVNYLLSGMHSYGHNDALHGLLPWLCGALAVVLALAAVSYWKWRTVWCAAYFCNKENKEKNVEIYGCHEYKETILPVLDVPFPGLRLCPLCPGRNPALLPGRHSPGRRWRTHYGAEGHQACRCLLPRRPFAVALFPVGGNPNRPSGPRRQGLCHHLRRRGPSAQAVAP